MTVLPNGGAAAAFDRVGRPASERARRAALGHAVLLLSFACASYRVVPPAPLGNGTQPIPIRYETSRALLFHSSGDDGQASRVFASGEVVLITIRAPQAGVYASTDGGKTFHFTAGAYDFREVVFAGGHLFARAANRIWHSADGGQTWDGAQVVPNGDSLDALAIAADGALWTAGRSSLYVSTDGARSFRPVGIQLPPLPHWRVRSIVPDAQHAHILHVSLRTEPQQELLPRFRAVLDFSSDEALSALKLADAHGGAPGAVSWGQPEDGVYVTEDGGGLWKKTGLSVDAWLAAQDGALYAVAAEPVLQAAAFVRHFPDLAGAAERQFKGAKADAAVLRAALPYPGREALLAGPAAVALIWKSTDGGATWSRLDDTPLPLALALRRAVERGGQDGPHVPPPPRDQEQKQQRPRPAEPVPPRHDERGFLQRSDDPGFVQASDGFSQRTGPRGGAPRSPPTQSSLSRRGLAPETLLCFVDPQRLLSRFNGTAPVSGVNGDLAWAVTQQGWDALVAQLIEESTAEGEISLGPADTGKARFEVLHAPSWAPGGETLPPGPPRSIAGTNGAVYVVRRDGRAFRIAP